MDKNRIKQFYQEIQDHIDRVGWTILGVLGDTPFAYTIGLHLQQQPELILIGLDPDGSRPLLNHLAIKLVNGETYQDKDLIHDLATVPLSLRERTTNKFSYTNQARQFYGHSDYRVRQIIMPDEKGVFPWELGCDPRVMDIQDYER